MDVDVITFGPGSFFVLSLERDLVSLSPDSRQLYWRPRCHSFERALERASAMHKNDILVVSLSGIYIAQSKIILA